MNAIRPEDVRLSIDVPTGQLVSQMPNGDLSDQLAGWSPSNTNTTLRYEADGTPWGHNGPVIVASSISNGTIGVLAPPIEVDPSITPRAYGHVKVPYGAEGNGGAVDVAVIFDTDGGSTANAADIDLERNAGPGEAWVWRTSTSLSGVITARLRLAVFTTVAGQELAVAYADGIVVDDVPAESVYAERRNYISGGNFEAGDGGFRTTVGCVEDVVAIPDAPHGDHVLELTGHTSDGLMRVERRTQYLVTPDGPATFSAFCRPLDADLDVQLGFVHQSGSRTYGPVVTCPAGEWTRVIWNRPNRVFNVHPGVYVPNAPAGARLQLDAYMLESATEALPYFGETSPWTETTSIATNDAVSSRGPDHRFLVQFGEPFRRVSIGGAACTIGVKRGALDLGSLTAELRSAELDPSTGDDTLRPNRSVRLEVRDPATSPATWRPLFTGTLDDADVDYPRDPYRRPAISLSGVDPLRVLNNARETRSVATVPELAALLAAAGVPHRLNGQDNQTVPLTVVATNGDAMLADQVAITRDLTGGHAHIDRAGVLVVDDADNLPAGELLVDETRYSGLTIGFSTDATINSVLVKRVGNGTETTQGPYTDPDSIREWGLHSWTVTLPDVADLDITAAVDRLLEANATPQRRVSSITLPIRSLADDDLILADLDQVVRVVNTARGIDETYRLTRITHEITAGRAGVEWHVTWAVTPATYAALPQLVPTAT